MANPGESIRLRSSARTSTGQVRENNEDNIHLWARGPFVLAVVADGMGGAAAGEEASRLAVEAIKSGLIQRDAHAAEMLESLADDQLKAQLLEVIQTANDHIVEKAASVPEYRGMGTTITLAFVRGTSAMFAHVGDSRAYLVEGDDGGITQITSDHSFVEALLAAGHITRQQADEHPMRNVLYRALGQAENIDVDMYYKRLRVGDRLVLCSDGLTRHVKPEEIARLALENNNPDAASQRLVDLANERGGEDNVSVIVIAVEASLPTDSTGAEQAAIAEDEDETLMLRSRLESRHPLPPTPPASPPPSADLPSASHADHAMPAERLTEDRQDDDDASASGSAPPSDPMDHAIATRKDRLQAAPAYENHSPPSARAQEKQGEGRDTLTPDQ